MKKILSFMLLGVLAISLTACGENNYIAKIDEQVITKKNLDAEVKYAAIQQEINLDSLELNSAKKSFEASVLNQLIEKELLLQEAKKRKISIEPKLITQELEQMENQFASNWEFRNFYVKKTNMNSKDLQKYVTNQLTIQKLIENVVKDVKITPNSLQNEYKRYKNFMIKPDQIKLTHVLVETEKEANEILKDLKENGTDIEKIALEKSIDPSVKENKGNLGFLSRNDMVAELASAAFDLEIGALSPEPVKSDHGYHVFIINDKEEERQKTFEEMEDEMRENLTNSAKDAKITNLIIELKNKAKIENKLTERQ